MNLTVTDGPLQPGLYRLTAHARACWTASATRWTATLMARAATTWCAISPWPSPTAHVLESRSNDSIPAATPLPLTEDPAGSGFLTSSVALGAIDPAGDSRLLELRRPAGRPADHRHGADLGATVPRVHRLQRGRPGAASTPPAARAGSAARAKTTNSVVHDPGRRHLLRARPLDSARLLAVLGSYQFRVDLGRSVQLEPYDFNSYNNDLNNAASHPGLRSRARPGTWSASVAGSLYSEEGLDYSRWAGSTRATQVTVASRTISVSGLTYKVQVVGKAVRSDARPGRQPARRPGHGRRRPVATTTTSRWRRSAASGSGASTWWTSTSRTRSRRRSHRSRGCRPRAGRSGWSPTRSRSTSARTCRRRASTRPRRTRCARRGRTARSARRRRGLHAQPFGGHAVGEPDGDRRPAAAGSYRFTAHARACWTASATRWTATRDGTGGDDLVRTSPSPSPTAQCWRAGATTASRRPPRCRCTRIRRGAGS